MTTEVLPAPALNDIQTRYSSQNRAGEGIDPPAAPLSDAEIASAAAAHSEYLLRLAGRYFACEADCHDALQDTFVAALRYRASFRRQSSLQTWLHRILVNACLIKLRIQSLRRWEMLSDDQLPARSDASDELVRQEEDRQAIRAAVCELSLDQRTVIQLRYFEGFSTEETAHILNVRPGAVKTRLHRSCRALRSRLEELTSAEGKRDFPAGW